MYISTNAKVPEPRFVMVTANKTRMMSSAKQIGMSKREKRGEERRGEERRGKSRQGEVG